MSTITIFHTEKIRDIILKESTTYYYIFLYFWVKWSQLELTVLILRGKEVPLSCYSQMASGPFIYRSLF